MEKVHFFNYFNTYKYGNTIYNSLIFLQLSLQTNASTQHTNSGRNLFQKTFSCKADPQRA